MQLKCLLAAMTIYNLAQIVTKMSFLLQYRRIFQEGGHTRRVCLWLIIFLGAWGLTQEFLVCFTCVPAGIVIPGMARVCIDSLTVYYLTSVMNIVTDFIVFTVPLPAVHALHLPPRQKLLVSSVFCLGFFTCVISIVRLFTLHSAVNGTDPTWDNVPSAYWSVVELNCGIMCASLPALRPFLRHFNVSGLVTSRRSRSDGYRREKSEDKMSFSKGSRGAMGMDAPGKSGGPVYAMDHLTSTSASQEALHESAVDVPLSIYRPGVKAEGRDKDAKQQSRWIRPPPSGDEMQVASEAGYGKDSAGSDEAARGWR